MRRAVPRLALFVVLLLVLDRLIFAGATYLRDNAGRPTGMGVIYDPRWNPQVAFFGDSRTKHNFDMAAIESLTGLRAYDYGRDGASAEEALLLLDEYLRHGHQPRVVVFEAELPLLDARIGQFFKEDFRDHLSLVPDPADLLRESPTLQERAAAWAVTWLARSASIANRLPDLWGNWRETAGQKEPGTLVYACGPHFTLRCEFHNGAELFLTNSGHKIERERTVFAIDPERMKLYLHIVTLAEQNGFQLLLAETPRFEGDLAYPPEVKAQSDAFFCGLARGHSDVLYARLTHTGGIDRDPSLYFDWTHFNSRGAARMSELIAPLIAALAKQSRPQPCLFE